MRNLDIGLYSLEKRMNHLTDEFYEINYISYVNFYPKVVENINLRKANATPYLNYIL